MSPADATADHSHAWLNGSMWVASSQKGIEAGSRRISVGVLSGCYKGLGFGIVSYFGVVAFGLGFVAGFRVQVLGV